MSKKIFFVLVYGSIGFPAYVLGFLYEVFIIGTFAGRTAALNLFPKDKTK